MPKDEMTPQEIEAWQCIRCGACFWEYINGCPHCWEEDEQLGSVHLKTFREEDRWIF